ncbi:MAG: GNAT family N-acetyltransferase [bacterium]|nr:GNAT family N-acetyltransferase [bacterium]MCP4967111.1 GNAT family N-acetyltransferase [bacterium]
MPVFAGYQPSALSLPPPDDLDVTMADQKHAEGIARLYSDREEVATAEANAWTQRTLGRMSERGCVVVATTDARVVGYGVADWLDPDAAPDGFYLLGVVVDPEFQRRGIAHVLTERRLDWLRERTDRVFYFANASNRATIDLHRTFGFRQLNHITSIAGVTFDGGKGILYEAGLPPRS